MIKYKLICKSCEETFDGWFASSKEFEKLKKKNYLNCHFCNSKKIEKTLMAPKLINNKRINNINEKNLNFIKINKKIREYQNFIKNNFEFVGDNFAYEARSIHYDNKKKEKGIFGKATKKEIKELKEEGIDTVLVPWIEDNNN